MTKSYIIYKIQCNNKDITDVYIGSTISYRQRKTTHKQCCNCENHPKHNHPKYQFIRDNGGWDNWSMIPIEEYQCETIIQARIREQYWIDNNNATLNTKNANGKNIEKINEWKNNNPEKLLHYRQTYENKNREDINRKALERYHANKEIINNRRNKYKKSNSGTINNI
jgi:hypothetical protein